VLRSACWRCPSCEEKKYCVLQGYVEARFHFELGPDVLRIDEEALHEDFLMDFTIDVRTSGSSILIYCLVEFFSFNLLKFLFRRKGSKLALSILGNLFENLNKTLIVQGERSRACFWAFALALQ